MKKKSINVSETAAEHEIFERNKMGQINVYNRHIRLSTCAHHSFQERLLLLVCDIDVHIEAEVERISSVIYGTDRNLTNRRTVEMNL